MSAMESASLPNSSAPPGSRGASSSPAAIASAARTMRFRLPLTWRAIAIATKKLTATTRISRRSSWRWDAAVRSSVLVRLTARSVSTLATRALRLDWARSEVSRALVLLREAAPGWSPDRASSTILSRSIW